MMSYEYTVEQYLFYNYIGYGYRPMLKALFPFMMTSSNGNTFRVTGSLCGEFTGHRWIPLTKVSDVFFDLRLNKRFNKQS